MPQLSNSSLHHRILAHLVEQGFAPSVGELAEYFGVPRETAVEALRQLEREHGVVLHPLTAEVWIIHPFSTAPTNFWVESARGAWWGNCAWCSLGIAALLRETVTITTTLGGESEQIALHVVDGRLVDDRYLVHFPVPMRQAWDNVVFTCSTMLVFDSEDAVDAWCARHHLPRGNVQPIAKVWELAKVWYGRHLDENWVKWTAGEARAIFESFDLRGPTWDVPATVERF